MEKVGGEASSWSEQEETAPRLLDQEVDKTLSCTERDEEAHQALQCTEEKVPRLLERDEEADKTSPCTEEKGALSWSEQEETVPRLLHQEADRTPSCTEPDEEAHNALPCTEEEVPRRQRDEEVDKPSPCTEEKGALQLPEQGKEAKKMEASPSHQAKKRGAENLSDSTARISTVEHQSDGNAAFAEAALLPLDPTTGKRKKYKVWQTELRQGIGRYFPEQPMKISHDSTFRQIAGWVQTIRGTTVELANLTGEEALRQVLPAGTDLGRGPTALYRAALEFLRSHHA